MEKLASNIYRQRLLIEGYYSGEITEKTTAKFFDYICQELNLTASASPLINSSRGIGKLENQGIEAFLPLIESGISFYTWEKDKFCAILFFTCKEFDSKKTLEITNSFLNIKEFTFLEF